MQYREHDWLATLAADFQHGLGNRPLGSVFTVNGYDPVSDLDACAFGRRVAVRFGDDHAGAVGISADGRTDAEE